MNWYRKAQSMSDNETLPPWKMRANSREYDLLDFDALSREAFGFSRDDIKTLYPGQLKVKWKEDFNNVVLEQKKSGLSPEDWAQTINLSEPIDVSYEDGKFYVEDGHHRYYAAKILNKPLNIDLQIKDKPHLAIVKKALENGELSVDEYNALHADIYGPIESFNRSGSEKGWYRTASEPVDSNQVFYHGTIDSFEKFQVGMGPTS